jgi:Toprim-like
MRHGPWLEGARSLRIADVASRLGFEVRRSPSADHCPCPACCAERRHTRSRDRRGAVGIPHARPSTWRCHQCAAGGDAVDFVAHALGGARFRDLQPACKTEVRSWFGGNAPPAAGQPARLPSPSPTALPSYPPAAEVAALWEAAPPLSRDPEVAAYLRSRGVDVTVVDLRNLARVLSPSASLPTWARLRGAWTATGHRVLVPLTDAQGAMRSLLGRSITPSGDAPKSVAPTGHARGGLVMACPVACRMLREPEVARAWVRDAELRVVIAEGEVDFLVAASLYGDTHDAACVGIFSGSWTAEHASRTPDGAVVVVATDHDPEGERYAAQIVDTFAGRGVALERWDPSAGAAQ